MKGSDYNRIARAIEFIETYLEDQPRLSEMAGYVGLSEFHFQRLFRRWVGITPKEFVQVLTLGRARHLLAASNSILDTSYRLGLSSAARLHDLFVSYEAMTPGQYKAKGVGLVVHWSLSPTPFGTVFLAVTERGVCGMEFIEADQLSATVEHFQQRWPEALLLESAAHISPFADEVSRRMRGQGQQPLTLLLKGSKFQVKVWEALLNIPEGRPLSYRDLASKLGMPKACRAVGSAVAANTLAYLIPCHRVIQATGAIGQYRWGSERKAALLAIEAAREMATY